jgi:hypothetical protein
MQRAPAGERYQMAKKFAPGVRGGVWNTEIRTEWLLRSASVRSLEAAVVVFVLLVVDYDAGL